MLLSAALIVKNEAKFLAACLASLQGLVDETVVVDTGSTDGSREIAVQAGARVDEVAWTGDFSAARNRALELARGEWILCIDADETVQAGCFPEIRAQLAASQLVGYYVGLHPRPGYTAYRVLRLFRNQPAIRFRGVIHESVWPAILERHAESDVGVSPLILDHFGYEGDQRAKQLRNLALLRRGLRDDASAVFPWCDLAEIYFALGKRRFAERALGRAIAIVRSRTAPAQGDYLPYARLIPWVVERGGEADKLMLEAVERFPSNAHLWWLRGRMLIDEGEFEGAIAAFERVLALGAAGDYDRDVAYDARIFDTLSYESLATCYFRQGRFEEALRYYKMAARSDPARVEYRAKQALCACLARSGREAGRDPR